MAENYTASERTALRSAYAAAVSLSCPACGAAVAVRQVPAKPELPYVRRRVWLICSGCKRSLTLEAEEKEI